jgi:hypothetical protein
MNSTLWDFFMGGSRKSIFIVSYRMILIGIIHIFFSTILSLYFLWRKSSFDKYYLMYFVLLNISWGILNDECLISYISKIIQNPNYTMGETKTIDDYDQVLGSYSSIFLNYILFMYLVNLAIIGFHSQMKWSILLCATSFSIYTYMLRQDIVRPIKDTISTVHILINVFLLTKIINS